MLLDRKPSNSVPSIIIDIFLSADVNSDRIVSIGELERYIHKTVVRHVQHGIQMNPICFARIDVAPRDGLVTWDEYHAYFLRQKGVSESYIGSHVEGNHVPLDRLAKGMLTNWYFYT